MEWDVLIRNGLVIDGTGSEPYTADVAIRNDTIDVIERLPAGATDNARIVIDASGMAIAPGFIDVHGHTDYELLINPTAESKVMQGITTEISGNCGFSAAPALCDMLRCDQDNWCARYGVDVRWRTLAEFLDLVEMRGIGINYATLVGHGVLRVNVMNYEARLPSDEELKQMVNLLVEALEHGAIGMSSGLIYPPGCYAQTDELIALCRTLRRYDGIYTTHIRDERAELIPALREAIEISRESGVPLEISHHKAVGRASWGKVRETLPIIERANFWGLDVTCDQYPYIATSTSLKTLIP
ncbi:MAG TPA: D-aminoacylase, partial [Armatimonadetes bacterium]|nr:D-aminoacylase [Armatimonadota bacterium]